MKMMSGLAAGAAIWLAAASAAGAVTVPVVNYSFEAPMLPGGTYQDGAAVPGWTQVGNQQGAGRSGVQNFNDNTYFKPADGNQVVYINNGSLTQDLGALLANTVYTLTVAAGNQPNYGRGSTGFLGFLTSTGAELSSTVAVPLLVGQTTDFSTSFTSGSSVTGNLLIALANRSGDQVLFDNVRVTAVSTVTALPEPASWAMMVGGFGLIGAAMRRRRVAVRFA